MSKTAKTKIYIVGEYQISTTNKTLALILANIEHQDEYGFKPYTIQDVYQIPELIQ